MPESFSSDDKWKHLQCWAAKLSRISLKQLINTELFLENRRVFGIVNTHKCWHNCWLKETVLKSAPCKVFWREELKYASRNIQIMFLTVSKEKLHGLWHWQMIYSAGETTHFLLLPPHPPPPISPFPVPSPRSPIADWASVLWCNSEAVGFRNH